MIEVASTVARSSGADYEFLSGITDTVRWPLVDTEKIITYFAKPLVALRIEKYLHVL